jgi:hypothetical protein
MSSRQDAADYQYRLRALARGPTVFDITRHRITNQRASSHSDGTLVSCMVNHPPIPTVLSSIRGFIDQRSIGRKGNFPVWSCSLGGQGMSSSGMHADDSNAITLRSESSTYCESGIHIMICATLHLLLYKSASWPGRPICFPSPVHAPTRNKNRNPWRGWTSAQICSN